MSDSNELLEWSVAARPMTGQTVSGDLHLVRPLDRGVLLAVVDGVGHGAAAAEAARAAVDLLERHATEPVISLATRCHVALAKTRGVVMTLASLDGSRNRMSWLGVGSVEGRLLHSDVRSGRPMETVLLRGGVVGFQIPELHAEIVPLSEGDMLIFATDGIRADFADRLVLTQTPEQVADQVVSHYCGGADDALVLVARYRGEHHE